jgi:hypothetical protein
LVFIRSAALLSDRSADAREHLPNSWRGHQVAHVAAEVGRQVAVVARRDDLAGRVLAQVARRETPRRQLALAVAGRHEDHQPVDLAALDGLQLLAIRWWWPAGW